MSQTPGCSQANAGTISQFFVSSLRTKMHALVNSLSKVIIVTKPSFVNRTRNHPLSSTIIQSLSHALTHQPPCYRSNIIEEWGSYQPPEKSYRHPYMFGVCFVPFHSLTPRSSKIYTPHLLHTLHWHKLCVVVLNNGYSFTLHALVWNHKDSLGRRDVLAIKLVYFDYSMLRHTLEVYLHYVALQRLQFISVLWGFTTDNATFFIRIYHFQAILNVELGRNRSISMQKY